jgi:hypothetical protein
MPEYHIWHNMRTRCTPGWREFHNYGGRGISVCERWANSFEAFYEDMGPRPSENHSIDRIDNDGNYEPGNCRWATRKEQGRNTRFNVMIEYNGAIRCAAEWAEIFRLSTSNILSRLSLGWSIERALTTPVIKQPKKNYLRH